MDEQRVGSECNKKSIAMELKTNATKYKSNIGGIQNDKSIMNDGITWINYKHTKVNQDLRSAI